MSEEAQGQEGVEMTMMLLMMNDISLSCAIAASHSATAADTGK
jgi:hypothetical protein